MNPQEQDTTESIVKRAQSEAKNKKYVAAIVILIILMIGSLVFGGVELWQNMRKEDEIVKLQFENDNLQSENNKNEYNDSMGGNIADEKNNTNSIEFKIHTSWETVDLKKCSVGSSCMDGAKYEKLIMNGNHLQINGDGDIVYRFNNTSKSLEYDFEFDGPIKQVKEGYFGNSGDFSGVSVLVLKENGTVGVIYYSFTDNNFHAVQNIDGLSGIAMLYGGINGTGSDVFAVKSDGSADSLSDYIDTLREH